MSYGRIELICCFSDFENPAHPTASPLYQADARSSRRLQIGVAPPALEAGASKTLVSAQMSYGRLKLRPVFYTNLDYRARELYGPVVRLIRCRRLIPITMPLMGRPGTTQSGIHPRQHQIEILPGAPAASEQTRHLPLHLARHVGACIEFIHAGADTVGRGRLVYIHTGSDPIGSGNISAPGERIPHHGNVAGAGKKLG